jgi:uncharacterized membrane-anchored protein YitT (DUF2179 family)
MHTEMCVFFEGVFTMKKEAKSKLFIEAKNIFLVLFGCFVLAVADAIFIVPCNIVNGGVDSIGIIINYYLKPILGYDVSDIFIAVCQTVLWIIGLFFLGRKFSFHTLLGSLAFPLFYALLFRTNLLDAIGFTKVYQANTNPDGSISLAFLILSGIFGGFLSGAGVALTYLGDGSTGGFDVVSFIIAKYGLMKQDYSGFIMDTSSIIIGLIVFRDWQLALVGILSAVVCAFAINLIYIRANSYLIADIISDNSKVIQDFIHEKLGHGTTVLDALGGYTGEERKLIRVVIYKRDAQELKRFIASVDPKAFVSFTTARAINGAGFEALEVSARDKERILTKYGITPRKPKKEGE